MSSPPQDIDKMSTRYAFVTLLTSDAYLPGALTLAAALNDVHRHQTVEYETVCLVTPETVDVSTIRLLRKAFNVVIGVEIVVPPDPDPLTLLGRPDLDTALTKVHAFRLKQYSKVIFLDADVLPLRPLTYLFHLEHEFSAVPDIGWPDIFNSGVMVFSPGEDKFQELQALLSTKGTWDGADQGLLNEWRGSNWNRLSFTYNTTPTATYTYAPAYQRFGSQISVIHFIGPHKPWHSLPYRAPGTSAQSTNMAADLSTETPATQQHTYGYSSLVDRWYSIYDQHYRSQAAEPGFLPNRYMSTWNEEDGPRTVTGGVLGLEELRRIALEGMGATGIPMPRAHGEGEYRTMPLEGRFDLIRPRTRAERKQAQDPKASEETLESTSTPPESPTTTPGPSTPLEKVLSLPAGTPVRWVTLPTPDIHEIPPAPHARLMSLPPTPLRYVNAPYKPLRSTRDVGAQTVSIPLQLPESGGVDLPLTPLLNLVVETVPDVVTSPSSDAYSAKAWDTNRNWSSSSSDTSLSTMEHSPSKPSLSPSPSLVSAPPEILHRRGAYRHFTRDEDGSPTPDLAKVRRVFPWEVRPRQAPGRVFPDEGSPFTLLSHLPVPATPERKATFRSPTPSPLVGFPSSLLSHYPSDSPLPQRYAGGFQLSIPAPSPLGPEDGTDKVETESRDGDVEDEVDSEATRVKSRTRKYRSIGVQTDPRDLREEGIQVTTFVPAGEVAEKLILMNKRLGRSWVTSTGSSDHSAPSATYISTPSPPTPAPVSIKAGGADSVSLLSPPVNLSVALPSLDGSPVSNTSKGSRVWDPARGVESFKRRSEEVLTKFVTKGSWEERA